jgi:5-dehydro-4-deoxyglucarate dehydratase
MTSPLTPQALKAHLADGLLGFPLTDFSADGGFAANPFADRVRFLEGQGCAALFVAGGAGEFFSLTPEEYAAVVRIAVETCRGSVPIIAGTGYGTRTAIAYAQEAERLGADGLLLFPPYLVESPQEGLRAHITAVCEATRLGVIVYNRGNCRLSADTLARIAGACPNLIGFKDGAGDIEQLAAVRSRLGDRLIYVNGMPTAETYARAFRALGIPTYSSAVFNFIPRTALAFHKAVHDGNDAAVDDLMARFFVPYVRIRSRQPGYAVSIVKAGARIVGRSAGKVRPPLSDLTADEYDQLAALIADLGEQG